MITTPETRAATLREIAEWLHLTPAEPSDVEAVRLAAADLDRLARIEGMAVPLKLALKYGGGSLQLVAERLLAELRPAAPVGPREET